MKKLITLLLALGLCLCSCGEKEKEADKNDSQSKAESTVQSESTDETTESADESTKEDSTSAEESTDGESSEEERPNVGDLEDITPYIKLGTWKGINIAKKVEVTEELKTQILNENYLAKYATQEETDAPAKEGDTVIMDYKGYLVDTNEAFEGGEAKDAELLLGSGKFVDGFESGIIGHSKGESFDIYLTFPKDYHEELANKEVRFAITLKKITQTVYPTPDEKILKELKFDSVDALNAAVQKEAEETVYTENLTNVWAAVLKEAEVLAYPEELHKGHVDYFIDYYEGMHKYYATYYGMEYADYLQAAFKMTEEEFKADLEKNAKEYADGALKEELTAYAVADAAFNREVSDEEYDAFVEKYAADNDMTIKDITTKYTRDEIIENILWDKVMVYLYENAVFGAQTE